MPTFRRRDKLMSHVRAYARLSPEERRTLLTNKGARERLAKIGLARCRSCPSLASVFDIPASSSLESDATERNSPLAAVRALLIALPPSLLCVHLVCIVLQLVLVFLILLAGQRREGGMHDRSFAFWCRALRLPPSRELVPRVACHCPHIGRLAPCTNPQWLEASPTWQRPIGKDAGRCCCHTFDSFPGAQSDR